MMKQKFMLVLPSKWKAHASEWDSFKTAKENLNRGQRAIAESPVETLSTFKDLPRIIQRCVVKDSQSEVVFGSTSADSDVGPLSQIVQLVRTLDEQLGDHTPQKIMETSKQLQDIADSAGNADMQLTVSAMFDVIGTESKVAKILKLVSQSVTLCAVSFLKSTLTKDYMTKDVRTSDGWQIIISFEQAQERVSPRTNKAVDDFRQENQCKTSDRAPRSSLKSSQTYLLRRGRFGKRRQDKHRTLEETHSHEPSVSVSHVRKEQSMDSFGDTTEHFEFMWDVLLRLELGSLTLREVQLHVRSLQFDAVSMPKSKGRCLRRNLATRRVV